MKCEKCDSVMDKMTTVGDGKDEVEKLTRVTIYACVCGHTKLFEDRIFNKLRFLSDL